MIFGLLAVSVFSPINKGQSVPKSFYLTYGTEKLMINDWWGRGADFPAIVAKDPMLSVKMDFGDWMQ
jgi:hypothetical protein